MSKVASILWNRRRGLFIVRDRSKKEIGSFPTFGEAWEMSRGYLYGTARRHPEEPQAPARVRRAA
jgi:hypothetical protein